MLGGDRCICACADVSERKVELVYSQLTARPVLRNPDAEKFHRGMLLFHNMFNL